MFAKLGFVSLSLSLNSLNFGIHVCFFGSNFVCYECFKHELLGIRKRYYVGQFVTIGFNLLWKKMGEKWRFLRLDGKVLENEGRILSEIRLPTLIGNC